MAVRIKCNCGRSLRVADRYIGDRVRCPLCREVLTVEAPSQTLATYACSHGHRFKAPAGGGCAVACPTCGQRVRIPIPKTATVCSSTDDADDIVRVAAKPVFPDTAAEKLLPIALLVGTAVATLIGIAWYVQSTGIE